MCSVLCRLHKFFIKLLESCGNCWELCVPVGPLISVGTRCQKSKGTEFPCVPAEIKPWYWRSFCHVRNATIGFRDPQNMGRHQNCVFALPNNQDTVNLCSSSSHLEIQDGVYFITLWLAPLECLTLKNTGRDTEIMPLSYLEPEIMLKTCSEWRPFWNPRWRPTNANPSLAIKLPITS